MNSQEKFRRLFVKANKRTKELGIAGLEIEHVLSILPNQKNEPIASVLIHGFREIYELRQNEMEARVE